jgi:hypothetical protein
VPPQGLKGCTHAPYNQGQEAPFQKRAAMVVSELCAKLGLEVDGKAFEVGESLIKGLEKGFMATAAAIVGVVGGFVELGRETAAVASAASKAAQRVGVTTDAIQELNFAAEASGVSTEALETALFRMSNAAYMAKHGSTEAAAAFHGLLSMKDLREGTPDEMLEKLGRWVPEDQRPHRAGAQGHGDFRAWREGSHSHAQ